MPRSLQRLARLSILKSGMKRLTKLFNTKASSVDEEAKTIRFKISDDKPDQMGEIVDQETWDLNNYMENPVLLWGHNPDEPETYSAASCPSMLTKMPPTPPRT